MSVFVVCVGLALAVGFHEAAHLLAARGFGIAVTDAYWGFGPKLWSKQFGETTYGMRWLPLGGYVKLGGRKNRNWADGTPIPPGRLLEEAARWKRMVVVFAGVTANVLFAFVLIYTLLLVSGTWEPTPVVDRVVDGSAAEEAGLTVGDRLLLVGDTPIVEWEHLGEAVVDRGGQQVTVVIERNGRLVTFEQVTLGWLGQTGFLGVAPRVVNRGVGAGEGLAAAAGGTIRGLVISAQSILRVFNPQYMYRLVTGNDQGGGTDRPVSLVGAVQVSSTAPTADAWLLVAGLNLSIAVLNVLPFPPFDGGHATMMLLARLRRRQLGRLVLGATGTMAVAWIMIVVVALIVLDVIAPVRI